jgi:MFS family permease
VSTATFVMGLGENLWRRFLPKYLESLGAPVIAIGAFGTAEDFLDGVYQYPGGWVADHHGRRAALLLFVSLAAAGYALFAALRTWWLAFVALALIMAWDAMASPTLFAVVGDALPREKRTMGFTVQSILRRGADRRGADVGRHCHRPNGTTVRHPIRMQCFHPARPHHAGSGLAHSHSGGAG